MRIVVLTGAGISAESGIPTFRDAGGLWEGYRVEHVASPEGFRRDPETVQRFYDLRREAVAQTQPNAAHRALARLEGAIGDELLIVTQNIDDLHERAGSIAPIHMHGELFRARCAVCAHSLPWHDDLRGAHGCERCGGVLRPDVVWFGEVPYGLERIEQALVACDLFVSIGTSGNVYPAAGFVAMAAAFDARTLELGLEPSEGSAAFDEVRLGPATQVVPAWVDEVS